MTTNPKKIGFLSFGAWHPGGGMTVTGGDSLRQTVELAVAAEEIGIDGAFVRVHHWARSALLALPAPGGDRRQDDPDRDRHRRHRYALRESALYGGESRGGGGKGPAAGSSSASAAALPSRPGTVPKHSGTRSNTTGRARRQPCSARRSKTPASSEPTSAAAPATGWLPYNHSRPASPTGSGGDRARAKPPSGRVSKGMNLMSSTLLLEDTQVPFDQLQAEQIALFREAWTKAGHAREPRVSVSHFVIPITSDLDRRLFGGDANEDKLAGSTAPSAASAAATRASPTRSPMSLASDAAVQAADTILLAVPEPTRRRLQRRDARYHRPRHRPRHRLGATSAIRSVASRRLSATTPRT